MSHSGSWKPEKRYLGDGVYAVLDASRQIVLTTENGISIQSTIYMDSEVWESLQRFVAQKVEPWAPEFGGKS